MRGAAIIICGLALALPAMRASAQSDDWERVPPPASQSTADAPATKSGGVIACTLIANFVEQAAKLRDAGATEESQLADIDNPSGSLSQLSTGGKQSANTLDALRKQIHRLIDYVYEHRELTPAQIATRARRSCGNSENGGEGAGAPVANPTRTPTPG